MCFGSENGAPTILQNTDYPEGCLVAVHLDLSTLFLPLSSILLPLSYDMLPRGPPWPTVV